MNYYIVNVPGDFFQCCFHLMEHDSLLIRIENDETQEFNLGINDYAVWTPRKKVTSWLLVFPGSLPY